MANTSIRLLREYDAKVISEAFRQQGWDKPAAQYDAYYRKQMNGGQVTLVAETDGDFAGYVNVLWDSPYPDFRANSIPEINDFNVLIKYRRRGIGTALMNEAEAIIGERSQVAGIRVGLYSDYGAAQVMYVLRGYVPDGKGIFQHDAYPQYGEQVRVDDDLVLSLTKKLR
ncbi:GNAT family N-acetyltransferase [Paenibacillus sp. GCM10023248]|uniref:GNAT family N-acetyltransferase n=1 Tax=Bacillales TaxID=1385 RepID=UPI002379CC38|nr:MULTISPECIES: GNAT family N-acetyltransferase [Bacillales]MDD9268157.1 GNAT family N-acetyltransferase [Paenibacillus sp. MAHUQ-63]MDR6879836.1 ribosomal protein S18 acetylase RimI-like enzyme [Bacillus sp. 3255]